MAKLKYLKCSMPNCHNTVGQHNAALNKNKQVCNSHRTTKKQEVDDWKMNAGCNNKGQYGFPKCTCEITHPCQLDINHVDGNNSNRDPSNIEVLCSNCHRRVTILNEHHIQTNTTRKPTFGDNVDKLFSGLLAS